MKARLGLMLILWPAITYADQQSNHAQQIAELSRVDWAPRFEPGSPAFSNEKSSTSIDLKSCTLRLTTANTFSNGDTVQTNYTIFDIQLDQTQIERQPNGKPYEFYTHTLDYPDGSSRPHSTGVITFVIDTPRAGFVFVDEEPGLLVSDLDPAAAAATEAHSILEYNNPNKPREIDIAALTEAILSYQAEYCTERP